MVQSHLLALRIAGLLPIGPARPHPAISAVAGTWVVIDWALAKEGRDGEGVWPFRLANCERVQEIITPARWCSLMFAKIEKHEFPLRAGTCV